MRWLLLAWMVVLPLDVLAVWLLPQQQGIKENMGVDWGLTAQVILSIATILLFLVSVMHQLTTVEEKWFMALAKFFDGSWKWLATGNFLFVMALSGTPVSTDIPYDWRVALNWLGIVDSCYLVGYVVVAGCWICRPASFSSAFAR